MAPKALTYVLRSYRNVEQSFLPARWNELPRTKVNGRDLRGSTCPGYCASPGLSQFTFSKLSSKCVWRVVNYCLRQDIKELHRNALHADTWLPLPLSNPMSTPKNVIKT